MGMKNSRRRRDLQFCAAPAGLPCSYRPRLIYIAETTNRATRRTTNAAVTLEAIGAIREAIRERRAELAKRKDRMTIRAEGPLRPSTSARWRHLSLLLKRTVMLGVLRLVRLPPLTAQLEVRVEVVVALVVNAPWRDRRSLLLRRANTVVGVRLTLGKCRRSNDGA
jgi:hypothetical protein